MNFSKSELIKLAQRAEKVFFYPERLYSWSGIILGVNVFRENSNFCRMTAVSDNTFRGYHRIDKSIQTIRVFNNYFLERKDKIIKMLVGINSRDKLDCLIDKVCVELKQKYSHVQQDKLESFNRIRKPVDLVIEHLVAMSEEITEYRNRLVPYLFLPLDSKMFSSTFIFTAQQLSNCNMSKNSKFGDLKTKKHYYSLQKIIDRHCAEISQEIQMTFYPIYFDMYWNNRYCNWGENLFETNPERRRSC